MEKCLDQRALDLLSGIDAGLTLAVMSAVGGRDNYLALASGDKKAVIEEVMRIWFDKNGRGIPFPEMQGRTADADRSFHLTQPEVDYAGVLARMQKFYGEGYVFMFAKEFQLRCEAVLNWICGNPQIANLLKGSYFPWVLPQLKGDLGKMLDVEMIPAMEQSYRAEFSNRNFTNYRHGELEGQVTVVDGTRQNLLVEAMATGSVCGVYFPALQGFSIPADREFITRMPEEMILAGMEIPAVVTAYPKICGRDWYTPGLDMASLLWRSSEYSLDFKAYGGNASFGFRILEADGRYAGGVSFLG